MPFVEQIRLIALLPRSWSYEDIMKIFGCSRHAIKTARLIQDDSEYMLKSEKESQIRQSADSNKIKHFVSWLVDSNALVSGKVDSKARLKNRTQYFNLKVHIVLQLCVWILVRRSNCQSRYLSCRKHMLLLPTKSIVKKPILIVFATENSSLLSQ